LGGEGLGVHFLFQELRANVDPLAPENKLFFLTCPLNLPSIPTALKHAVVTKSPLTGIFLKSMASGTFALKLKAAGYDGIIVEGFSEKPVYLWINNGKAEIRKAGHLWGMTTHDAQLYIREEVGNGDATVASIGPAGENLVRYACILFDRRAAGRGGPGAVMGSKRLKAIAVNGDQEVPIANPERLKELTREVYRIISAHPTFGDFMPKYGTAYAVGATNEAGAFPTRNFQTGVFEGAEGISGELMREKYTVKISPCPRCPIACNRVTLAKEWPYVGSVTEGPEYETLALLGGNCGIDRMDAIIAADRLCDEYGLDTISAGNVIAFAMECYERSIITKEDTDGLELRFGNAQAMIEMLRRISFRQGLGKVLAEGVRSASKTIGEETVRFAIHVKGMELPGYDPRAMPDKAIAYAIASRGGCHLTEIPLGLRKRGLSMKDAVEGLKLGQEWRTILDTLGLCRGPIESLDVIANLVSAVTGMDIFPKDLMMMAERIVNLERIFNVREGISRSDDTLPERFFTEPIQSGPTKGQVIDRGEFNQALDRYYELRGWSKETGAPTEAKLRELGLSIVKERACKDPSRK
ncbi:MAG: aldehyde ferredoxin oxidoreductase family protein, partial [Candidatus Bathyarchaeia archaeon]